jgi:hypothetical protein
MTDLQISLLVVIVVGICEAAKYAGLPSRWIPLLSVVLGLAGTLVFGGVDFISAAAGVILGLATTGGYKLVKTTILNK